MINEAKIHSFFSDRFGEFNPSTNGWWDGGDCPFCGSHKLTYHPKYWRVKCWKDCFNGTVPDFISYLFNVNHFQAKEILEEQTDILLVNEKSSRIKPESMHLPPETFPILEGDSILAKRARTYLRGRGFNLNILDRKGIRYCTGDNKDSKDENYFGYLIIPFYRNDTLVYFTARDYIGNFVRYKNPPKSKFNVGKEEVLFNEYALYNYEKVSLTEGWGCAITIGDNGVSYQGSSLGTTQTNILLKSPVKQITMIPDAGYYWHGLKSVKPLIGKFKIKVLDLNIFKTQGIGKDVNEIGKQEVEKLEELTPFMDRGLWIKEMRNVKKPIHTYQKK
jgi:hypothetical protein